MRCVSLGAALRERGNGPVRLVCEADPMISSLATDRGLIFEGVAEGELPAGAADARRIKAMKPDLVILDTPKAGQDWIDAVHGAGTRVAYLAGASGPAPLSGADLCFWPEACPHRAADHAGLRCGLEYVILGSDYWQARPRLREGAIQQVLVTTGGADHHNLCALALRVLDAVFETPLEVTVVVGAFFKDRDVIAAAAQASRHKVTLADCPSGLYSLLAKADLTISGGGGTLYEMARLGVPGIGVAIWPIQAPAVGAMAAAGTLTGITWEGAEQTAGALTRALHVLRGHSTMMADMSRKGPEVIDGQGALRMADELLGLAGATAAGP